MSAPTQFEISVVSTGLVVLVLGYNLVKFAWNQPLQNGPGFFLGVEVPSGFYDGPGKSWLRNYRAVLVALHLILAAALATIIALWRWNLTPLWAGGAALLYVPTMIGFAAWTRHKLGANPPVRPVAVALESRHLRDYISWPLETLSVALIGCSWWLLLSHGGKRIGWLDPLGMTWCALGLLPAKILAVRCSFPIPAERAEEHYQYQDVCRRIWIRAWSAVGWFLTIILFGGALRRAWSPARRVPGFQWLIIGIALVFVIYYMILVRRAMRLASTLGRNLLPPGSWATPFSRAPFPWTCASQTSWTEMGLPYLIWFAIWFGGILVFIVYSLSKSRL
jgi:hypothetical protein